MKAEKENPPAEKPSPEKPPSSNPAAPHE